MFPPCLRTAHLCNAIAACNKHTGHKQLKVKDAQLQATSVRNSRKLTGQNIGRKGVQ